VAKEIPLLDRIYKDPLYQEICRFVGYFGTTVRELQKKLELLGEAYGKTRAEAAIYHLVRLEGNNTVNPKPLAKVGLRSDVRRYCFMLLGPTPETWDSHFRNPDGTPMPQHAEKLKERERLTGKKPQAPKKPAARPKATKRAKKQRQA
jgi:hypothetical protein